MGEYPFICPADLVQISLFGKLCYYFYKENEMEVVHEGWTILREGGML